MAYVVSAARKTAKQLQLWVQFLYRTYYNIDRLLNILGHLSIDHTLLPDLCRVYITPRCQDNFLNTFCLNNANIIVHI